MTLRDVTPEAIQPAHPEGILLLCHSEGATACSWKECPTSPTHAVYIRSENKATDFAKMSQILRLRLMDQTWASFCLAYPIALSQSRRSSSVLSGTE